ncbi:MAG: hypothetical protein JRE81_03345, partial [Deltaproteobacteria bacterium]|nr:hypothetical protein [Deltaproteobacteria bacterium]
MQSSQPTITPFSIAAALAMLGAFALGCAQANGEPPKPKEADTQAAPDADVASKPADSSGKFSPVKARARDFYAPNTEDLGPNEMRLIACGTGMPTARPKQAASCWLLELGNGDKFIFDIGTGSAERI